MDDFEKSNHKISFKVLGRDPTHLQSFEAGERLPDSFLPS